MRRVVTEMRLRRETLGWTRAKLAIQLQLACAEAQSVNGHIVKRWELRRHTPSPVFRRALCRMFAVEDIAQLGLGNHWSARLHWTMATDQERAVEVRRRKLLAAGLAAAGTALLPRAPELFAPGKVDAGWLRDAKQVTTSLASLYRTVSPGQLQASVHGHLGMLVAHLGSARLPADRTRLHLQIADAAAFAGWIEFRLDQLEAAAHCFHLAETHAREAGDRPLLAQVLGSQSLVHSTTPTAGRRGNARRALELVEHAHATLGSSAPRHVLGRLMGRLAEERAVNGDGAGCARALESAATLLSGPLDVGDDGFFGAKGYHSAWDPAYFGAFAATCQVHLGAAGAVDALARTARHVTAPERTATVTADLAAGYAQAGAPELAAQTLLRAYEQAVRVRYPLGVQRVLGVRSRFEKEWERLPSVRDLDEQLRRGVESS